MSWDWCQIGGSWVSLEQSPQPVEMGGPGELRLSGGWWSRDQCFLVHVGKHEPLVEGGPMSTQLLGRAEAWPPYISALGGLGGRTSTISMRLQKQTSSSIVRWPSRCSTR